MPKRFLVCKCILLNVYFKLYIDLVVQNEVLFKCL